MKPLCAWWIFLWVHFESVAAIGPPKRKKKHDAAPCPTHGSIWQGVTPAGVPSKVDIVISHCKSDLAWLTAEIDALRNAGLPVVGVTIFSKCNKPITARPPNSSVIILPNVGRCDHNAAYYMARQSGDAEPNQVVLFIKDTNILHQAHDKTRPLKEAIELAAGSAGFSCGHVPRDTSATFFDTETLIGFKASRGFGKYDGPHFHSDFGRMGDWLKAMQASLPTPATPVCMGGVFAVSRQRIAAGATMWPRIEQSLTRADSLEEGHFAERAWAGLLMNVDRAVLEEIRCRAGFVQADDEMGYRGRLDQCDLARPSCFDPQRGRTERLGSAVLLQVRLGFVKGRLPEDRRLLKWNWDCERR